MSLYRKYRPLDFESLKGQGHVSDVLKSALKKDRVSHAYLFTGPRGTGKTSTARILARAINCLKLSASGPCNSCEICTAALEERLTDLVEIDAASHGLVDDARALVEQAKFMPVQAKRKIYVIDEVHMLSKSAFNALLKIIEEPPDHVHFILATTEAHKVLETIKSRCQRFDFHLAEHDLIVEHLQEVCRSEKISPHADALDLLATHARGSFRDALSLLEQLLGSGDFASDQVRKVLGLSEKESVSDFVDHLISGEHDQAIELLHDIHHQGLDLYQFCQMILENLRLQLLSASSPELQSQFLQWIDIFFHALDQLRDPVIPELPLELALLKCRNSHSTPSKPAVDHPTQKPSVSEAPRRQRSLSQDKKASKMKPVKPLPKSSQKGEAFDIQAFIFAVQQASLRSLLKFSQLSFENNQLIISARSGFELEKLKSHDNHKYLLDVLQELTDDKVSLSFHLLESSNQLQSSKDEGISTTDLESVF